METASARFIVEVDNDGMCGWSLVDDSGKTLTSSEGFTSVDECRDSVDAYKAAHESYADTPVEVQGTVPNI